MKSGLSFLVAARRCEIDELDQLARTSELVGTIGRLVHALQRERGLSNVLLASQGQRYAQQRSAQIGECIRLEHDVRTGFDRLETEGRRIGNGTRLFSRIAWVLPGLDALPVLRRRIGALEVGAADATAAFAKLIAGLLAVVFEAADGATDPEISRLLAAMFNFMQGKEFAGQERACGAAAFVEGRNDPLRQQQWLQLIAAQERCFNVFADFAGPALTEVWRHSQPAAELAELERLRRVAHSAPAGATLDRELSTTWFDCCSLRIDAMKAVEERLAADLRTLCAGKIAEARAEAETHQALLDQLVADTDARTARATTFFDDPELAPAAPYGHQLERSILEMLQEQSQRLQAMSDELDTVRATLNERKLVERAKGLLMAHRRMTEEEAHKMLRQTAMNQNRRLVDVAESVLSMAEYLPGST
ncbi:nitrate regulatory protein [Variovorax fucosicus]|uniref:nitrate regulatory protein n=1 Tax=Variovorax fucosicus TaxID=3053517 RepID=UPI0025782C08|nr:nitrate regulatory protein [Variovorax sp. J22G47]MDM0059475.1 nitrate- and nitrite sensing domain-containing protein [Variovorax sp. J22G47]